jgi:D-glycero-D-manno-heptose 1,7-bisphosphate phosphatase
MKYPVLFLDRDGVVNQEKGYIGYKEDFIFNESIFEICRIFKLRKYKIIIITNQSGIGRNKISLEDFHNLNLWMLNEFERKHIRIEFVLASAVNPHSKKLTEYENFRRKPLPGMFIDAGELLPIDFRNSFMLGDRFTDGVAAQSAGVGNIYIISQEKIQSNSFISITSLETFLEISKSLV